MLYDFVNFLLAGLSPLVNATGPNPLLALPGQVVATGAAAVMLAWSSFV